MAAKKQFKKTSVDDGAVSMPDENEALSVDTAEDTVDTTDNDGDVTLNDEVSNTGVESADEVNFNDNDIGEAPAPKNVRISLKTDHNCVIGGEHYHFVKGKQYNVPYEVKSILKQADLLMPL